MDLNKFLSNIESFKRDTGRSVIRPADGFYDLSNDAMSEVIAEFKTVLYFKKPEDLSGLEKFALHILLNSL